jgi:hypothetical protein
VGDQASVSLARCDNESKHYLRHHMCRNHTH